MTEEFEARKKEELLGLLSSGVKALKNIKDQPVVDFTRYRRNTLAMKKIAERIGEMK